MKIVIVAVGVVAIYLANRGLLTHPLIRRRPELAASITRLNNLIAVLGLTAGFLAVLLIAMGVRI